MKKMKTGKGLNIVWVLVILAILVIIMLFTMKEGFKNDKKLRHKEDTAYTNTNTPAYTNVLGN
jgi:competence protein ComGC